MVLSVIDRSLERVGDQTLANVPQMEQLRKKLLEDALEFYEELLAENTDDAPVRFAVARVYVRVALIHQGFAGWDESIRLNEKAIAILEDLVGSQPSNQSYRFELATALKQRSWTAGAILSTNLDDARRAGRAVDIMQDLHDEFPNNTTYQESLLETLVALSSWRYTIAELEALVARMVPLADLPDMNKRLRADVKGTLAVLNLARGRLDDGEGTYREAIHLDREAVNEHPTEILPRFALVRVSNRLGKLLTSRGKHEEAVECFEESVGVAQALRDDFPAMKHFDNLSIEALVGLAHNLHHLGRTDEEAAALSKCPDQPLIRGMAYFQINDFEKAIADFTQAARLNPDRPDVLCWRGRAHYAVRDHTNAIADYNNVLNAKPDHSAALNELAWLLATSHDKSLRDGKRAIELATKCCQLTEYKDAHTVDTLAASHAEAGDFDAAIEWSTKALELEKSDGPRDQLIKHLDCFRAHMPWREP
jgi:tetratricopeptide (TPR) repeat protein